MTSLKTDLHMGTFSRVLSYPGKQRKILFYGQAMASRLYIRIAKYFKREIADSNMYTFLHF